jgi:hypothetical protein
MRGVRWHTAMVRMSLLLAVAGPLVAQPTPPRYSLAEDRYLVIAPDDVGPVRFAVAIPTGGIILSQTGTHRVIAYDRAGRFSWSFGRKGDKSGVFGGKESRSNLSIVAGGLVGDTLWVFDRILHRVTYISLRGELIRTVDLPPAWAQQSATVRKPEVPLGTRAPVMLQPVAMLRDGDILVRGQFGTRQVVKGREVVRADEPEIVRMSPRGVQRRRIAHLLEPVAIAAPVFGGDVVNMHPVPFLADPADAVAPDGRGVATLTTDPLSSTAGVARLTVINSTGDTAFARLFPFEGVPISQAEVDSVVKARVAPFDRASGRRSGEHNAAIAELREGLREAIPPAHAPFRNVRFGSDSTIWLGLRQTSEGQPFMLLDDKGEPIATVVLPPNRRLLTISRNELWAITDETRGVIGAILRYRIVAP